MRESQVRLLGLVVIPWLLYSATSDCSFPLRVTDVIELASLMRGKRCIKGLAIYTKRYGTLDQAALESLLHEGLAMMLRI